VATQLKIENRILDTSLSTLHVPDVIEAASILYMRIGPRAVTLLTANRLGNTEREQGDRLSANDCYVALHDACTKMAKVAIRKFEQSGQLSFEEALPKLFPDPAAYLACAIKSVVADEARRARRDVRTVSLNTPIRARSESDIELGDLIESQDIHNNPEASLLENSDRSTFRSALNNALKTVPSQYLEALQRDMQRDADREAGISVPAVSDKDRQAVCRARAALSKIIIKECSEDNPFVHQLAQQRNSRVRTRHQPSKSWSGERQHALLRRLMESGWASRAVGQSEGAVEEAVVNEVSRASSLASPSPEMRKSMRVLDLYTVDYPTPASEKARELYESGRALRSQGDLEGAIRHFKAVYDLEPGFVEALTNVGNLYTQKGNLRDALRVFLSIIDRHTTGDHQYRAATNAADIYLTWYDAGRNREKNIELAIQYARLAMTKPTPMRACNLILAYAKDRYYFEARTVLNDILTSHLVSCPADKMLQTLFQIRDEDLIAWWSWLDEQMDGEN